MNIPNFPTDHLYKFIAIAGLALSSYCVFFAYQQVWELRLQILRTETEEKVIDHELEYMNKELDVFLSRKSSSRKGNFNQEKDSLRDRAMTVIAKKTRIEGKKKENELLNEQLHNHYVVLWGGIVIGLLMSFGGFRLWYVRVQKPNELLMEKRLADWKKASQDLPE